MADINKPTALIVIPISHRCAALISFISSFSSAMRWCADWVECKASIATVFVFTIVFKLVLMLAISACIPIINFISSPCNPPPPTKIKSPAYTEPSDAGANSGCFA